MTDLRCITVRQPWAWAIIHEGKDVENRKRNVAGDWRGLLAIHAGLSVADDAWDRGGACDQICDITGAYPGIVDMEFGAIIGVVQLVGVHRAWDSMAGCCESGWYDELPDSMCSDWAESEAWHLELANARQIDPIPARGKLGLWRPDDELKAKVLGAIL